MFQRLAMPIGTGLFGIAEVVRAQIRAEFATLRDGFKTWADSVEARANPPRTMPLRSVLD